MRGQQSAELPAAACPPARPPLPRCTRPCLRTAAAAADLPGRRLLPDGAARVLRLAGDDLRWVGGRSGVPACLAAHSCTHPAPGTARVSAPPRRLSTLRACAGWGTLTLLNATHAEWGYQRVYDPPGEPADFVAIRRNPACPYGAPLPAPTPAPAPAAGSPVAASAAVAPGLGQLAEYAAALLAAAALVV